MADETTRRSGRSRGKSKKYTVDAFEGLDIDDGGPDDLEAPPEDPDADDDFDAVAAVAGAEPDEAEDRISEDDEPQLIEDDDDDPEEEFQVEDDDDHVRPTPKSRAQHNIDSAKRRQEKQTGIPGGTSSGRLLSRGLIDIRIRGSKEEHRMALFGPAAEDQDPALRAHFKWGNEPTLPSRQADAGGFGGFHPSYSRSDDARKREAIEDWKWYDEAGGRQMFEKRQVLTQIDESTASAYKSRIRSPREVVMGPYASQKKYSIPIDSAFNINVPFTSISEDGSTQQNPKTIRHGWMLNLGDKIQCLEWAPNQGSNRQYLMVSTVPLRGHGDPEDRFKHTEAPSWNPQPPHKAIIQIWEFITTDGNYISMAHPPRLRQAICTEYGDIKSLKWCPAPRQHHSPEGDRNHLGLLLGLWKDGAIRILDISVQNLDNAPTEYLHCSSTAFTSRPANTIYSAIAWLSAKGLTAGCANGYLGVFNLPTALLSPTTPSIPTLFSPLSTSYILSLTTAYPSRPHIILSSSMSGHISMTDLLSVSTHFNAANTAHSSRSRIERPVITWHDTSQMLLICDDIYTVQGLSLRRFYGYTGFTRLKSACMAMATSPVHPFVIAGTVSGETVLHNPIRRTINSKAELSNQIWFAHEWRRSEVPDARPVQPKMVETNYLADPVDDVVMADAEPVAQTAQTKGKKLFDLGLVRVTEGYKPESLKLFHDDSYKIRENGTAFTTIYEAESAVTAVCWNPNIQVGGWCAAGMASGLLRVEDIARAR